ncbi:hypothetical protein [Hydrogenobaculum acidophilum]
MRVNADTKSMETLIKEIKDALKRPFEYQNISSKLQELVSIIEKSSEESTLKHMDDLIYISTLILELNNIVNGLISETLNYIKSKGFSARA